MVTQVIEESESAGALANNDLLIFFRPGQTEEKRKSWATIQSLLAITDDTVLDLIETTRDSNDRSKFLKVSSSDENALSYAFLTDDELLDVAQATRGTGDRGKAIGTSSTNQNVLALLDIPAAYVLTDDAVLDLVKGTRAETDRGKALGVKADDEDELDFLTIPPAYVLNDTDVLNLANASRTTGDRGKFLTVSSTNQDELALVDSPTAYTLTDGAVLDLIDTSRTSADRGKALIVDGSNHDALAFQMLPNFVASSYAGSALNLMSANSFVALSGTTPAPHTDGMYIISAGSDDYHLFAGAAVVNKTVAAVGNTPSDTNSISISSGSATIRIGRTASAFLFAYSSSGGVNVSLGRIV